VAFFLTTGDELIEQRKAIALFSGGLDSLLAVFWMKKLRIDVIPVFFQTPFFSADRALQTASENGLKLVVKDISSEHLAMLHNPRYGFGKNFNPCIDCHGLMFNLAGNMLEEIGADFLISGEVLGQRPMSQRKDAMNAVAKLSGYRDLLIRPLSQTLLADTLPIREGWINKEDMLSISGRSRKPQMSLAKQFNIVSYPSPAGGCRLTDKNYTLRLRDLLENNQLNLELIALLKYGRHFRLDAKTKLIIGRDEADNQGILEAGKGFLLLLNESIPGPLGLLCTEDYTQDKIAIAASILAHYNSKSPFEVTISYGFTFPFAERIIVPKAPAGLIQQLMLQDK
jgi:tRNA-uridine 2-sulfurtransferase